MRNEYWKVYSVVNGKKNKFVGACKEFYNAWTKYPYIQTKGPITEEDVSILDDNFFTDDKQNVDAIITELQLKSER